MERPARGGAKSEVRLIGGQWKRSRIEVLDLPGLRPTPDRVRETLFNWLGQDLTGWRVLDAFAGSGALGFEAASRGAAGVTLIEADRRARTSLEATCQRLQAASVRVVGADAMAWLGREPDGPLYDLILLDPPYAARLQAAALAACRGWLAPQGLVYLEDDREWSAEELAVLHWQRWRCGQAGAVHFHLLRRLDDLSD
jgi:16S rRNA (guanine(966)-N(2))-methyltransferase RsmD